jgi:hypothetical protein
MELTTCVGEAVNKVIVTIHCVEISERMLGNFSPSVVTLVQPWRRLQGLSVSRVFSCFWAGTKGEGRPLSVGGCGRGKEQP